MKFFIEQIPVFFPFDIIYPEQIQLMYILKKLFDNKCHGIISLPPTINFPISTIGFFLSYDLYSKLEAKLIYCSPSNGQISDIISQSQILLENPLKNSWKKINSGKPSIFYFAEKEQLCINSRIQNIFKKNEIEDFCESLISPYFLSQQQDERGTSFSGKNLISYSKRPLRCLYFYNLQNKKFLGSLKGVWSIDRLQRLGSRRKICPFFLIGKKIKESNVLVTKVSRILSQENTNLFKNRNLSSSFLVFDNIFDLEKLLWEHSGVQLNSLILNDCKRSLMLLRKRNFLIKLSQKKKFFCDFINNPFPFKNFQKSFLERGNFRPQIFSADFYGFSSGAFLKTSFRIFRFLEMAFNILSCFGKIFRIPFVYNWSIKEFETYFFSEINNFSISCEIFKYFPYQFWQILKFFGVFQYRFFNGFKILGKFIHLFGVYLESSNENVKIFFSPFFSKSRYFREPLLTLLSVEHSHVTRNIFENFRILLICANFLSPVNLYQFQLDCLVPIHGAIGLAFKKKFIFSIWTSFPGEGLSENNSLEKKTKDSIYKNCSLIFARIIEKTNHGIICFFPNEYPLDKLLKNWEKDKTLKEFFKEREIFTETHDLEANLSAIENYKFCCDLGRKAIFLGIYEGILTKVKLNYHYRRIILLFDNSNFQTFPINQLIQKKNNCFPTKKKSDDPFTFSTMNQKKGYLLNRLFKSKLDFGAYFVVESTKKIKKKPPFPKRIGILGEKESYLNLEKIRNKFNNFFISWNTFF